MKKNPKYSFKMINLLISLFLLFSCTQLKRLNPQRHCYEERSAIKIAPKYIHYIRAKVDSCDNKLHEILEKQEKRINLAPFLKNKFASANFHGDNSLFNFIKNKINHSQRRSIEIRLSASSEFSKDQYTKLVIETIARALQKKVVILSKKEEAISYFLAYKASPVSDANSQAFWFLDNDKNIIVTQDGGSYSYYYSELGADAMRRVIVSWKGGRISSPYPIGAHYAKKAILYSSNHASEKVNQELRDLLKSQKVAGINHFHFLMSQFAGTKGTPYSRFELEGIAKKRITNSDGHQFADTDIAGLLLILGHMRALKVETILPKGIEEESGILFHSTLW